MKPSDYPDIFEPFEKLVKIELLGEVYEVPENNTLLRCFQFLSMETVSFGEFCWNGECGNCQVWIGDSHGERAILACRQKVWEKMKIARISENIKLKANGK